MDLEKRLSVINIYISKLPTFSPTVKKVLEICNNPNTPLKDLSKVISMDPVLLGKVLNLVNSAYYGISNEISSIVRAITMLGTNTVKNLVLSTAIMGSILNKKNFKILDMESFWIHSLGVGVASKLIAREQKNIKNIEDYFVSGMLHDIGKILLNTIFSEEYEHVLKISNIEKRSLVKVEQQHFFIDHALVGKLIASSWNLSQEIIDTISFHHNVFPYKGDHKNIIYTIAFANSLISQLSLGFSGNYKAEKISPEVLTHLNLSKNSIKQILKEVNSEIEKAKIFLKIA